MVEEQEAASHSLAWEAAALFELLEQFNVRLCGPYSSPFKPGCQAARPRHSDAGLLGIGGVCQPADRPRLRRKKPIGKNSSG
ncbi:hypothetical protein FS834_21675 [Agrobacterium vitis]|nr:hypothetical protein [Allorhizobium ampelinum]